MSQSQTKEFEVKVERNGRAEFWPIKAPNKAAAEAHAALLLKRRGGKQLKVISATEVKK
jgi:hypothetical protein